MQTGKRRKLIIVGASSFAQIACEYFEEQSDYQVVAFAVENAYLKSDTIYGRPLIALEDAATKFHPDDHDAYVAVVYSQLNRLRTRLMNGAHAAGYQLASFISPRAYIASSAVIGPHAFVFENNVVQSFVNLGSNVVLWSGNHIGHHSTIEDNVFVASHVVISGGCRVGANSFLGVNVAVGNDIKIGRDCWIGPGVTLTSDVPDGTIVRAPEPLVAKVTTKRFFKLKDD